MFLLNAALRAGMRASSRRGRWFVALAVGLAALQVLGAGPVSAAPGDVTEFPLFGSTTSPGGITAGPDANLWFVEQSGNRVGRITINGALTEFSAGITAGSGPFDITAGPDGNLWFTEHEGDRVARITFNGTVTEFAAGITADAQPTGITAGPDGNLWFAEYHSDRIGQITPTGAVTEFSAGITAGSGPSDITAGPDGNLWFTEFNGGRIGRITPTGAVTEFTAGITGNGSSGITAGPDGNLWFAEPDADRIGRITTTGAVTEFAAGITADAEPTGITAGPDGNLWFTEYHDAVGRITPTGTVTEYAAGIADGSEPFGIATGLDGNLWFTEYRRGQIGRLELGPGAMLSPPSHDFGKRAVDTASGARQFTVTNTGTAALIVGDVGIGGANGSDFATTGDHCSGATVVPGDSCTIGVRFTPGAVGARSAKLNVPDNTAASLHTAALAGAGVAPATSSSLPPSPRPSGPTTSGGGAVPQPESAGLASTGPSVRWPAGIGAAVLVLGAALTFAGRKRGRRSA